MWQSQIVNINYISVSSKKPEDAQLNSVNMRTLSKQVVIIPDRVS